MFVDCLGYTLDIKNPYNYNLERERKIYNQFKIKYLEVLLMSLRVRIFIYHYIGNNTHMIIRK